MNSLNNSHNKFEPIRLAIISEASYLNKSFCNASWTIEYSYFVNSLFIICLLKFWFADINSVSWYDDQISPNFLKEF